MLASHLNALCSQRVWFYAELMPSPRNAIVNNELLPSKCVCRRCARDGLWSDALEGANAEPSWSSWAAEVGLRVKGSPSGPGQFAPSPLLCFLMLTVCSSHSILISRLRSVLFLCVLFSPLSVPLLHTSRRVTTATRLMSRQCSSPLGSSWGYSVDPLQWEQLLEL